MARNNQKRESWFEKQQKKLGTPDFLSIMLTGNQDILTRGIVQVFRDIANFNIDLSKEGQYFLNMQFLDRCLEVAYSKLFYHTCHVNGVLLINDHTPQMEMVLETDKRARDAYQIVYDCLYAIKNTGDINNINLCAQRLRNYRFNI